MPILFEKSPDTATSNCSCRGNVLLLNLARSWRALTSPSVGTVLRVARTALSTFGCGAGFLKTFTLCFPSACTLKEYVINALANITSHSQESKSLFTIFLY